MTKAWHGMGMARQGKARQGGKEGTGGGTDQEREKRTVLPQGAQHGGGEAKGGGGGAARERRSGTSEQGRAGHARE